MTTSVSMRSPGRLNPTRQQLDELDALLQRMLDLPVSALDEPEQVEREEPAEELPPPVQPPPPPPIRANETRPIEPRPSRLPISYMVVETASPRPLPPASGFEPRKPMAAPQQTPLTPLPEIATEKEVRSEEEGVRSEEQHSPPSSLLPPQFLPDAVLGPSVVEPGESDAWVPLRSTWQPSPQTWPPLAESWHQAKGGTQPLIAPSPSMNPRIDPVPPTPPVRSEKGEVRSEEQGANREEQGAKSEEQPSLHSSLLTPQSMPAPQPQLSLSAEDAPLAVPAPLLPLVWFNQGFDACLAPLGAPGRWVCERGRPVLGFLGLAGLALAAALAIGAGMAWTW